MTIQNLQKVDRLNNTKKHFEQMKLQTGCEFILPSDVQKKGGNRNTVNTMNFIIGDSVIVKEGIKKPDSEDFELGGWQGRIVEIDSESNDDIFILITIEWDSLTLTQLPEKYIQQSEIEGLDWGTMTLYASDLDKTVMRDNKDKVKKMQDFLSNKYYWASHGKAGLRISKILDGLNPKDEMKCLQKWDNFLEKELSFPVKVIVVESENDWVIKDGDTVKIKSLTHIVDMYGIIAKITKEGQKYEFPLCDLEVIDTESRNYQLIDDYRIWFGNR